MAELLNQVDNHIAQSESYIDSGGDISKGLAFMPKNYAPTGNGDYFYQGLYADSPKPSVRDQEMLQHSSIWGHKFISGGMGEGPNYIKSSTKTDTCLPAYCNPPNPCPHGYSKAEGCIVDFDNTAIFSREYQASQECMCDSEHMFDCPSTDESRNSNDVTSDIEKFLVQQFQTSNEISNKNFIAKKLNSPNIGNPYLKGEKLPTAAKKGDHVN